MRETRMAEKLCETFVETDLLLFGQLELNEIHGSAEPLDERRPLFAPSGEPGIIILIGQVELVYREGSETVVPYYRFWVELPDLETENGL